MADPQHFSIIVLDVESSGALSGPEKTQIRQDLYAIVHAALEAGGVPADARHIEDRGDGIFLLVGSEISKRRLFGPFLGAIDEALSLRRSGDPRLRLRVVIHHGEVIRDKHGASGSELDRAFAMVDSEQLRAALSAAGDGRLALVVADDLYLSVVHGYPQPDPDRFRKSRLESKRGVLRAWITVTGAREQPGSGSRKLSDPPAPAPAAAPVMRVDGDLYSIRRASGGFVGGRHTFNAEVSSPAGDR